MVRIDLDFLTNSGFKPRFHPNGFIQLNLNKNGSTRLHVWPEPDSGLKKQESDNTIHDHIFDMESRILCGKLTNVVYGWQGVDAIRNPDIVTRLFEVYQADYPTPKEDSFLHKTNKMGFLNQIDRVTMTRGSEYALSAWQYHDSISQELTATVMHKTNIYGGNPRVLCRYGTVPDVVFSRFSNPEELMWAQILKVMSAHVGWFEIPEEYLIDTIQS